MRTVGEILRQRAETQPDWRAFTLLSAADAPSETALTFSALDRSARAVAVALDQRAIAGERVLLALPPGRGYLAAFFGCSLAGAIIVPCYPPHSRHRSRLLAALAVDSQASVVITDRTTRDAVDRDLSGVEQLRGLRTLVVDDVGEDLADGYRDTPSRTGLALLQYTSGSTAAPKGVMVGHDNLLANTESIREAFGWSPESIMAMWCPWFHDMGLFGAVVGPVIVGFHSVLLRPEDFVMRPLSWLEAISRYRATMAGGPNFGYDLCVTRTRPEQRVGLDLSTWTCAFNGAEPVRAETLDRFAAAFEPCGFRRDSFHPCYGMAEATLFISGGGPNRRPAIHALSGPELSQGRVVGVAAENPVAQSVVGCGSITAGHSVVIADDASWQPLPDGHVGEIWFTGPSVTHGYWRNHAATEATFAGRLRTGEGPFLRTGDLGFTLDHELYIIGRIKDIVIIRGRNHSPADIELTVRGSHPALRPDGVAFSVAVDGEERLVVAQEVRPNYPAFAPQQVIEAIRGAVAAEHGIEVYAVVLLRPRGVPKTTSGKVQRRACRARFLTESLPAVAVWRLPPDGARDLSQAVTGAVPILGDGGDSAVIETQVESWLVEQLAGSLGTSPREVDVNRPFADFGLDSAEGMRIAADLSVLLGRTLPATLVWDHPTIAKLARYLTEPQEAQL